MNITITGRHINVSDNLREYAERKIEKLEKYFNQIIDAHCILYVEKLYKGAEVLINGDGVQFHGRERAETFFSTIDLLFEKMEKQISKYKEKHSSHKAENLNKKASMEMFFPKGNELKLSQVSNKPIDNVEAYLQMKVEDDEFILFKKGISQVDSDVDFLNKNYSIIFKKGDAFKMVEVPIENFKEQKLECDTFVSYDLNIIEDSISNPRIEFKKDSNCSVQKISIEEAFNEIQKSDLKFLPFYNIESHYFNIIVNKGKEYELVVPAF